MNIDVTDIDKSEVGPEGSKNSLRRLTVVVASLSLIPLIGVLLIVGTGLWGFFRESGFELSQEWLSKNPGFIVVAVFGFVFVCSVLFAAFAFYLQWKQTKKFLNEYWESAKLLGIRLDPTIVALEKTVPFTESKMSFTSASGIGKITWMGKEVEVIHNYEMQRSPHLVIGGMIAFRQGGPVTIMEVKADRAKSPGAGICLVRKDLILGLDRFKWKGQVEVELNEGLSVLVYQMADLNSNLNLKNEVIGIFNENLLAEFLRIPGENSLMYCDGVFRLHHQGFAKTEELRVMLDFIGKFL